MFPTERSTAGLADVLRPIQRARVSDQVAAQIRELIARGRAQPGDLLPSRTDLASLFGVATGTVEDALQRLQMTGMVERRRRAGTFVAHPDTEFVAQTLRDQIYLGGYSHNHLFEMRIELEALAVRLAMARARPSTWSTLDREVQIARRSWHAGTWHDRPDAQLNFHLILARCAGNDVLTTLVEAMLRATWTFVGPMKADSPAMAVRSRRKLLRQMRAGDADGAVETQGRYLRSVLERGRRAMAGRELGQLQERRNEQDADNADARAWNMEMARREGWMPRPVDDAPAPQDRRRDEATD